jgi:glycine C-acetyltransferase
MPMVIGGLKRLELLRTRPEIKAKLWENTRKLQDGLKQRGFNIGDTNTCVTPVMMQGTPVEATLLVKDLRENYGIFTSVVVYPVIPKGMILLRLIPTASHTDSEINETLAAFEAIHDKLVGGHYKDQEQKLLAEQGLSFKEI